MKKGCKVEGNFRGKNKWFLGEICNVRPDKTFDVLYDDGDKEIKVVAERIRLTEDEKKKQIAAHTPAPTAVKKVTSTIPTPSKQVPVPVVEEVPLYKEGDRVESDFKGKGVWYHATISHEREDGTYNVEYDDPVLFKEYKVPKTRVRKLIFKEGNRVLSNFKGRGHWYVGFISSDRDDGTFNVEYDDVEIFKEYKVPSSRLRMLVFKEGDRVHANFKGKGKWSPGMVTCDREDGTYNVEYDDAVLFKEYKVPAKCLRPEPETSHEEKEEDHEEHHEKHDKHAEHEEEEKSSNGIKPAAKATANHAVHVAKAKVVASGKDDEHRHPTAASAKHSAGDDDEDDEEENRPKAVNVNRPKSPAPSSDVSLNSQKELLNKRHMSQKRIATAVVAAAAEVSHFLTSQYNFILARY